VGEEDDWLAQSRGEGKKASRFDDKPVPEEGEKNISAATSHFWGTGGNGGKGGWKQLGRGGREHFKGSLRGKKKGV